MKNIIAIFLLAVGFSALAFGNNGGKQAVDESSKAIPKAITFPAQDGVIVYGNLYGKGDRGIVLVHGGQFTKESWDPQARILVANGFCVLSIDLRGFGHSQWKKRDDDPLHFDVLAAVRYLRKQGAKTVSVVGGSMGGGAAADASIASEAGEIDRVVLLAGYGDGPAEKIKGRKLFILTRDDANSDGPRLPKIREYYEKASDPKKMVILEGSAHAQFIFQTEQGERLMREILSFLLEP